MPLPKFKITMLKDGREVRSFRDSQGLVRTSRERLNWTKVEDMRALADYGILLQLEQCAAGLGSDGRPMPPLKRPKAQFAGRRAGVAQFSQKNIRNLYGTGKEGGHMLDAIRVNYLDDTRATITISAKHQRDKARGNEKKAPWWGWSPASMAKFRTRRDQIFGVSIAGSLFDLGLIGASALAFAKRSSLRKAA